MQGIESASKDGHGSLCEERSAYVTPRLGQLAVPRNGVDYSQETAELSSMLDSVRQASGKGSKRLARLEGIIQAFSSEQDREDASAGLKRLMAQLRDLQQNEAGLQERARRLPLILKPCRVPIRHCERKKAISGLNCCSLCHTG